MHRDIDALHEPARASIGQNVEMLSIQWGNNFDSLSVNVIQILNYICMTKFLITTWLFVWSYQKWTSKFNLSFIPMHQYWCTVLMHREMSWSTAMKWTRVNQTNSRCMKRQHNVFEPRIALLFIALHISPAIYCSLEGNVDCRLRLFHSFIMHTSGLDAF